MAMKERIKPYNVKKVGEVELNKSQSYKQAINKTRKTINLRTSKKD
jgi:hypothetical protein